jgi:predicted RNA binding protein YcfA (HicA-like mRNA interferase family)
MGKHRDDVNQCKTARDFDRYITQHGGAFDRQCGSHAIYHTNGGAQIIVPQHNGDLPTGTRCSIIKSILKVMVWFAVFWWLVRPVLIAIVEELIKQGLIEL